MELPKLENFITLWKAINKITIPERKKEKEKEN